MVRYPKFLAAGDRIGVTSPSSGVPAALARRLDVAVGTLEARGYGVTVGMCMDGSSHVSAPAQERADELMAMLLDPQVRAVVPTWDFDGAAGAWTVQNVAVRVPFPKGAW